MHLNGFTEGQIKGLDIGRARKTNDRPLGFKWDEATKKKIAQSNKKYWNENPVAAIQRSRRGEDHYLWKGGGKNPNSIVRRMVEYAKWSHAVKERDLCCVHCGTMNDLEAHHVQELAIIIERHTITSYDEARKCPELWDIKNGKTLCRPCHKRKHKENGNIKANLSEAAGAS